MYLLELFIGLGTTKLPKAAPLVMFIFCFILTLLCLDKSTGPQVAWSNLGGPVS